MPRDRLVLLVACLAQFMVVLDVSIVNVALPAMREALGFSATGLQWVVSAYTLAFAGFLLLGGRAADLFGRRRMFLVGLALFGAASLVGGLADSPGLVLAARAAQGLGGAVLSPATLTILTTTFAEGAARARALGAWAAIGGVGGAVGGIAGGVLVHFLSWRWIFLVNVPVVVLTAVLARIAVSETRADDRPRLDTGGALLVTGGLVAFVHGVVSSESAGWSSALTWGSFVVAAVLLAGFVFLETRIASPLVPLGVFRIRSVSVANGTMALISSAMFAMWYFVSIHMQGVLGFDALTAGLAFLPQSATIVLGSQFSSRMLSRVGARPLLSGGAFLTAAGFAWFALLTPTSTWVGGVLGPGIAVGLGMGVALTPLAGAATSGVDRTQAGLASGLLNTSRQVGGAIGLAVLSTLATARADALTAGGAIAAAASTAGTTRAFAVAAVVVAAAGCVSLLLPRSPRPTRTSTPDPVGEPVDGAPAR
ncbi:DHA2 family efflux MFS transporter permease subunit [Actinomycetospora termitidis]|uniref:MFS transporter n=1 Tax=Actinomycetospora termitidis TaxID=3053470 RepID=A0ABT7MHY0_9PSEU|nr:MFS transporter [Actinomycetospora sp. Odt1-22]MDL5160250.1 MFS transporter [Actinomycetospora sp. Odt1-22]